MNKSRKTAKLLTPFFAVVLAWVTPSASPGQNSGKPAKAGPSPALWLSSLPPSCKTSPAASREISALLFDLTTHPDAAGFDLLGMQFSQRRETDCAVDAFRIALRLDPEYWEANYHLATELVREGNYQQAADVLEAVVRERPSSADAHSALGLALQNLGQLDSAQEEFETALGIRPDFISASQNLAGIFMKQRRYSAAVSCLEKALAASPSTDFAKLLQTDLATAYSRNGDYAKAEGLLRQLVGQNPDASLLHFDLANVLARRERYSEAAAEYIKTLQLDSANESALLSLAKSLMMLNRPGEVIPCLREYFKDRPQDPEGYSLLGQAYKRLGQYEDATEAFRRLIQINPQNYDGHYNLGFCLARLGQSDAAIEQLYAAVKLKPEASEPHYELGSLLSKKNEKASQEEFQEFRRLKRKSDLEEQAGVLSSEGNHFLEKGQARDAAAKYEKALQMDSNNAQVHYNLSLALSKLGDSAAERGELEKAIQADPKLPYAHNRLGLRYLADEQLDEAEKEFKTALVLNPQFVEAESNLGVLYARQRKYPEAVALFRRVTEDDPQNAPAFRNWGLMLADQGKYVEAEERLREAVKIAPQSARGYTDLGMLELNLGRDNEALPLFQKATALEPESTEAHLNLGSALAKRFDLNSALEQFRTAVNLSPSSAVPRFSLGQVLVDLGRDPEAQGELEIACHLKSNYSDALYLLALARKNAGNFSTAAQLLEKVVALDTQNSAAQHLLGLLFLRMGNTKAAIERWKRALSVNPNDLLSLYCLVQTLGKLQQPEVNEYRERLQGMWQGRGIRDPLQQLAFLGLEQAKAHDWSPAIAQLQGALRLCGDCPQSSTLHKDFGLIYAWRGDATNARRELRQSLELSPHDPDALRALRTLDAVGSDHAVAP